MINSDAVRDTELLLLSISRRLAGREDCKGINYKVTIRKNSISMYPEVLIYPNRYSKKESDRVTVLSYLLAVLGYSTSDLINGTYVYRSSIDHKKRKWFRERG